MKKRILSVLLTLVMLIGLVTVMSVSASAAGEHTHCVCGAQHASVGDHTELSSTKFTAVTTQEELQSAATEGGCVYLANDIALTSTLAVAEGKTLTLCLNGKKLSCAATVIKVEASATFHLTDCGTDVREGHINAATKLWTAGTGSSSDDVEYNLTGGVITGGQGMTTANFGTKHAGAIRNSGTVYIYSGNVAGNQAIASLGGNGGAIFNDTGSSLYVYGGSIVGNYANESIIFNYEENNVVLTGNAVFAYNTLVKQYSVISSRYGNGSMEISGNASFSHNHGGWVVNAKYEPLVIKDDASFTDNQVNNVIYYLYDMYNYELEAGKDFRMDGSILMEGNTKPDDGSPATDLFVDFEGSYGTPDALIILTAPLTRSYSVELPYNMMGGVLVKGDGTNVTKLTAADAAKFTDVDGRPMTAANDVVYAGIGIFDQPDENNNYTVNATDNPTYQWYVIGEGNYNVTDEMVTWSENNYDSATGKWSAVVYGMAYYFEMNLYAGDVITLVFDDAVEGDVVIVDYTTYTGHVLTVGEGNTYTFTAPNDCNISLAVDNGGSVGPAMLTASASDTTYPAVTASVHGRISTAVAGQTDATLNTENLESGRYLCEVTWAAEDGYSAYILMTDIVTLQYYDVIFDYGTLGSKTVSILEGKTITAETPEFTGHIFMGWFTDATYQTAFDFDTPITVDTIIYAKLVNYESDKTELENALTALQNAIENKADAATVNAAIANLEAAIDALEAVKNDYAAADSALKTELEAEITAAQDAAIDAATTLVNNAKAELQTAINAKADAATVNAAIANLEAAIDALEAVKNNYVAADSALKTELEAEITAAKSELEALISNIQSELDAAKAKLDKAIADLNKAIANGDKELSDEIAALDAALADAKAAFEKADADNKAELTEKIDTAESSLKAAVDALSNELNAINEKVAKLEKLIVACTAFFVIATVAVLCIVRKIYY